jgi:transglutaminase-like putative cysteine protease
MAVFIVRHRTIYRYKRAVRLGQHRLLFRPRDSFDQHLLDSRLVVSPQPCQFRWVHDAFGNCVTLFDFDVSSTNIDIESTIRLDRAPESSPDFEIDESAKHYPFDYDADERPDLSACIQRQYDEQADDVLKWLHSFVDLTRTQSTGRLLMTLNQAIADGFSYVRRTAPGTQSPWVTLRSRKGTCRDFALLMMEAVRSMGFAARFVTGYIYVSDRDGPEWRGGGATHAWCQVYVPGSGWVEFDPTNGIVGNRDLIRVAVTRTPEQAVPLSGSYWGDPSVELGMEVEVNVKSESGSFVQCDNLLPGVSNSPFSCGN